jgi:glutaredoxin
MEVVLFTRRGCHLCERVEDMLALHSPDAVIVDVDAFPEHVVRYGLRVPVVQVDGVDLLEGRIDESSLVAALPREDGLQPVKIRPTGSSPS